MRDTLSEIHLEVLLRFGDAVWWDSATPGSEPHRLAVIPQPLSSQQFSRPVRTILTVTQGIHHHRIPSRDSERSESKRGSTDMRRWCFSSHDHRACLDSIRRDWGALSGMAKVNKALWPLICFGDPMLDIYALLVGCCLLVTQEREENRMEGSSPDRDEISTPQARPAIPPQFSCFCGAKCSRLSLCSSSPAIVCDSRC
ncbi:hypothetical protein K491DRAFT_384550 [Lophiostoma macrostomum CBS 122681]|uniref:Uncharacterized protein n=1 Tax=Lophiostoma macrostomum CBS 122681 TaxID=1314788 RepID=A0A6A6TNU8_9PLEO|nr:hypothetical protein K491DRAFT_384550 [Lophiostoma macrostomum CBS 122681]